MKTCRKCGETKPLDDFPGHPKMAAGHLNACRECVAKASRAYFEKNRERVLDANRTRAAIRMADPEARQRERDRLAAWRAANPDKWKVVRDRANEKARTNGTAARGSATRRARMQAAKRGVVSLKAVLTTHGMHCSICDKPIEDRRQLTFDHVIALVHGGLHTEDNLRPAHRSCNSWKAGRSAEELHGLTPPKPGEIDEWEERRIARRKQMQGEASRRYYASLTPEQAAERGAKISASRMGHRNPPESYRGPTGRVIPPEERARRAASVRAAYAAWTPEQHAAHAAKISATKRARGSQGNIENLAKGWTPEVHARAIKASADARRGKAQSDETKAKRSESLKRAYAEGRHPGRKGYDP